ncbi:hypothetical protein AVEN_196456-1 [Araneus ventricosus]|uniref:Uncharacterized protein n=1 Tax=Araneus ventricosus TaxID=182803 RepID=A0A4Y2AV81_ARAVE|nr:hypothetical protein AVEN_196456-1 [Araneus ventricosus]
MAGAQLSSHVCLKQDWKEPRAQPHKVRECWDVPLSTPNAIKAMTFLRRTFLSCLPFQLTTFLILAFLNINKRPFCFPRRCLNIHYIPSFLPSFEKLQ